MEKKTENPLIVQLKENLSLNTQNLFDNETLEKFLIANKNNLEETLKNIKDFAAWQDQLERENFLTPQEIRDLKTHYPHGYSGVDIEGRPVLIEQIGRVKVNELFKLIEDSHLALYFAQRMEQLRKQILPHVQKKELLVIIDLKGQIMKMGSKRVYSIIEAAVNIFQRFYPQTLYRIYFVNTPLLFETVWAMIKKNISPETQKKIVFLGSDFEQQIQKIVSKANLPQSLGGNIEDDEFIEEDRGPWVKEHPREKSSDSESEEEIDFSKFKDLKAALSNVIPANHQVPHGDAQTPLNTESDQKN